MYYMKKKLNLGSRGSRGEKGSRLIQTMPESNPMGLGIPPLTIGATFASSEWIRDKKPKGYEIRCSMI